MKKEELNGILRTYVRENLSPKPTECAFISEVYGEIQNALGQDNCRQIGSYPRSTAITPVEDLDVLYIAGEYSDFVDEPLAQLRELADILEGHFRKTGYNFKIDPPQSHSVCLNFPERGFSVDIVPAYKWGQNEFDDPVFKVPEIMNRGHSKRADLYQRRRTQGRRVGWILSDPLGYIKVAQITDENNSDFRKATKLIKRWKFGAKNLDENVKLKSFHAEQIITLFFNNDPSIGIFDAVFKFFVDLPKYIKEAQIPDRADATIFIDEYINSLTEEEVKAIIAARDTFLIGLENITDINDIADLLNPEAFYERGSEERFMFDHAIPILTEPEHAFRIDGQVTNAIVDQNGKVHPKKASPYWLSSQSGKVATFRRIIFQKIGKFNNALHYRWKVKNDHSLEEEKRRGEITDHRTKNHPEHTSYIGNHYVECYGILDGVCVAKSKINVHIR